MESWGTTKGTSETFQTLQHNGIEVLKETLQWVLHYAERRQSCSLFLALVVCDRESLVAGGNRLDEITRTIPGGKFYHRHGKHKIKQKCRHENQAWTFLSFIIQRRHVSPRITGTHLRTPLKTLGYILQ